MIKAILQSLPFATWIGLLMVGLLLATWVATKPRSIYFMSDRLWRKAKRGDVALVFIPNRGWRGLTGDQVTQADLSEHLMHTRNPSRIDAQLAMVWADDDSQPYDEVFSQRVDVWVKRWKNKGHKITQVW